MKMTSKLAVTAFLSMIMLTGCGFNAKNNAVIMINDTPITKQQYDKEYKKLSENPMFKQMGVDVKSNPDGYVSLMLKDRVINELMVRTLLEDAFKKHNIKVSDADVEQEIKNIIDKVGSKEKFNEVLKQNGISAAQFKNDMKEEIKIKKLVEQLSMVKITDDMAKKFYNENLDKFRYPDKVRASHILISADADRIKEVIIAKEENKNLSDADIDKEVQKELAAKLQRAQKLLTEAKKILQNLQCLQKIILMTPEVLHKAEIWATLQKNKWFPNFQKQPFQQDRLS